jgi:D-aspartate ligase
MGLGVIRALGELSVPVFVVHYDSRDMGYVSRYVVEDVISPHPDQDETAFHDCLMELGHRLERPVLMPTSDASLIQISRNKEALSEVYEVACSDYAVTERYIDKHWTHQLADDIGVPSPGTHLLTDYEDACCSSEEIRYPCLVKPDRSHQFYAHFHTKMLVVNSPAELIDAYEQASQVNCLVMAQEIIPGGDDLGVNYNSYFIDGEPVVEFTAAQVRNAPPEFGSPRVVVTRSIPEVIESGQRLLSALRYTGFSCIEFKQDPRDGAYKLMEINGRHNLSTLLAVRCGVNFPWIDYRYRAYGDIPASSCLDCEEGTYWIDLPRDLVTSLREHRREQFSLGDYLKPYFRKHVFAILDLKDLRPLIRRIRNLLRKNPASQRTVNRNRSG